SLDTTASAEISYSPGDVSSTIMSMVSVSSPSIEVTAASEASWNTYGDLTVPAPETEMSSLEERTQKHSPRPLSSPQPQGDVTLNHSFVSHHNRGARYRVHSHNPTITILLQSPVAHPHTPR